MSLKKIFGTETEQDKLLREQRERAAAAEQAFKQLVSSVEKLNFDAKGAELTFSARVKEETGWDDARLTPALREYRRFLALAAISSEPLVPSQSIDAVWQVHLLYNRHYISGLCGQTLKKLLHRKPAKTADFDLNAAYARTLALYEEKFGQKASWGAAAASYCKVVALPQTSSERRALASSSSANDGSSDFYQTMLILYIINSSNSYNHETQMHGSGASSVITTSASFTDSGTTTAGSTTSCGGGGGGGGGGCGGGV
jgi:hypothetical protein